MLLLEVKIWIFYIGISIEKYTGRMMVKGEIVLNGGAEGVKLCINSQAKEPWLDCTLESMRE